MDGGVRTYLHVQAQPGPPPNVVRPKPVREGTQKSGATRNSHGSSWAFGATFASKRKWRWSRQCSGSACWRARWPQRNRSWSLRLNGPLRARATVHAAVEAQLAGSTAQSRASSERPALRHRQLKASAQISNAEDLGLSMSRFSTVMPRAYSGFFTSTLR